VLSRAQGLRTSITLADSRASLSRETEHTLDAHPVRGFRGSLEEIERQWYEQVYRGRGDRMRQLTCERSSRAPFLAGQVIRVA